MSLLKNRNEDLVFYNLFFFVIFLMMILVFPVNGLTSNYVTGHSSGNSYDKVMYDLNIPNTTVDFYPSQITISGYWDGGYNDNDCRNAWNSQVGDRSGTFIVTDGVTTYGTGSFTEEYGGFPNEWEPWYGRSLTVLNFDTWDLQGNTSTTQKIVFSSNYKGHHTGTMSPVSPAFPVVRLNGITGNYTMTYTSEAPVSVPVANFACDNEFSQPDATITCVDLSENNPTSWIFEAMNVNLSGIYLTNSEPWQFGLSQLGDYDVHLQACNDAGCDWENKTAYLHIQMFPCWTATPTPVMTAIPWTNISTINMSAAREQLTGGNANISAYLDPWFATVDYFAAYLEGIYISFQTFLIWPFTQLTAIMVDINGLSGQTMTALASYTVIPLAITAKTVTMFPWPIKAIITMGLMVDTVLLVLRGQ